MSGQTIDEQILAWEMIMARLKSERKQLNRKVIQNKQNMATVQNIIRKLKEERRLENDQGHPGHDQSKSALG